MAASRLVQCVFALTFCCTSFASGVPTVHDVTKAVEKMVSFYGKSYTEMNIDGIFGLRVIEGQLGKIVSEIDLGKIKNTETALVTRLRGIRAKAAEISKKSLPYLSKDDPTYFDNMAWLVKNPWSIFHSHQFLNPAKIWVPEEIKKMYNPRAKRRPGEPDLSKVTDLSEETSDKCMNELLGSRRSDHKTCQLTDECLGIMTKKGLTGYGITHQILYTMLAEIMGCVPKITEFLMEHGTEGGIDEMRVEFCTNNYNEMNKTLTLMSGTVWPVQQDLFLEQEFVCPNLGFVQFLNIDWLKQILSWQRCNGCYGKMYPVSHKESKVKIKKGKDGEEYEYWDGQETDCTESPLASDSVDRKHPPQGEHKGNTDTDKFDTKEGAAPGHEAQYREEGIDEIQRKVEKDRLQRKQMQQKQLNSNQNQKKPLNPNLQVPAGNAQDMKQNLQKVHAYKNANNLNRNQQQINSNQNMMNIPIPNQNRGNGNQNKQIMNQNKQNKQIMNQNKHIINQNKQFLYQNQNIQLPVNQNLPQVNQNQKAQKLKRSHGNPPQILDQPQHPVNQRNDHIENIDILDNKIHKRNIDKDTNMFRHQFEQPREPILEQHQFMNLQHQQQNNLFRRKERNYQMNDFRNRRLLAEKDLKDGCLSHKTAVAAGALVMYLRFMIDPGPPEFKEHHQRLVNPGGKKIGLQSQFVQLGNEKAQAEDVGPDGENLGETKDDYQDGDDNDGDIPDNDKGVDNDYPDDDEKDNRDNDVIEKDDWGQAADEDEDNENIGFGHDRRHIGRRIEPHQGGDIFHADEKDIHSKEHDIKNGVKESKIVKSHSKISPYQEHITPWPSFYFVSFILLVLLILMYNFMRKRRLLFRYRWR